MLFFFLKLFFGLLLLPLGSSYSPPLSISFIRVSLHPWPLYAYVVPRENVSIKMCCITCLSAAFCFSCSDIFTPASVTCCSVSRGGAIFVIWLCYKPSDGRQLIGWLSCQYSHSFAFFSFLHYVLCPAFQRNLLGV